MIIDECVKINFPDDSNKKHDWNRFERKCKDMGWLAFSAIRADKLSLEEKIASGKVFLLWLLYLFFLLMGK